MMAMDLECDVLVAGSGASGFAAALTAASSTPARVSGGSESGHELSSGAERLSDQELQVLQQAGLRS
jgi:flavin-dependent dehydrogenase